MKAAAAMHRVAATHMWACGEEIDFEAEFSDLATELRPSWSLPLVTSPPLPEVTGHIKLPPHQENVFASAF